MAASRPVVPLTQQPEDQLPADPLDVSQMTREQRDALKRKPLARHPGLVEELTS